MCAAGMWKVDAMLGRAPNYCILVYSNYDRRYPILSAIIPRFYSDTELNIQCSMVVEQNKTKRSNIPFSRVAERVYKCILVLQCARFSRTREEGHAF